MSIDREEIVFLRDTFIDAETDYLNKLLENDEINKLISDLGEKFSDEELYNMANDLVQQVDLGQIKDEDMELIEIKILILLVAIRDVKYSKQLVKVFNSNNIIVGEMRKNYIEKYNDNSYKINSEEFTQLREKGRMR